jgi:cytosine/adenosine deaminase-related metal-dependent hydrolase
MRKGGLDRRTVLTATTAAAAASVLSRNAAAQNRPPSPPPAAEFVLRGAQVLTMDPAIADLASGDVHVRDGVIMAIGANVDAPGAVVIDGKGMLCMPGLVETHWHHWTNILRTFMRWDDPNATYFPITAKYGVHYTPEISYRSARIGFAEALSAGITTTQNWCHNTRSPDHADAEIQAMRDVGIRGRFAYGPAQGQSNENPMDFAGLKRVKEGWKNTGDMVLLAICARSVDGANAGTRGSVKVDMAKKEWTVARELGLPITMHTSGSGGIKVLDEAGLLGPDVQLVHPLSTTAEERAALAKNGVSYSTSPVGEARRPGEMQIAEMHEAGVRLSISVDHVTTFDANLFDSMRMLATVIQHRHGNKFKLTSKQLVQMATIGGARDLGFGDKVGSLTPGKRADIILLRKTDLNMTPMGDAYDALVTLAQPANVDTVIVNGRILRRKNQFTTLDLDRMMQETAQTIEQLKKAAG